MSKETAIEYFARFTLLCIFYLGIGLAEWHISISDWHVYSRLILFYCGWLSYTIKFEMPVSG